MGQEHLNLPGTGQENKRQELETLFRPTSKNVKKCSDTNTAVVGIKEGPLVKQQEGV